MLSPTILLINKKTRLSSFLFDEALLFRVLKILHIWMVQVFNELCKILVCRDSNTSGFFDKKTTSTPKKTETQNYHI